MNTGLTGIIIGSVLLCLGVPFWLISDAIMIKYVLRNQLITKGPFSLVLHPIYTSVALLIIPGLAFVFDTWVLFLIGVILYIISRIFRGEEEKKLEAVFSKEYQIYRSKVILPWL
jgi:protein-S-isoprenylcysteine O-methyltransferase Ste14